MAALQASRNANILTCMLRFRIGLRLALGRDPRLLNHFYLFIYGPAAMRLSQHFKEIENLFLYHFASVGARFIKVFGQTGDDHL
jgi:hypothetical protein